MSPTPQTPSAARGPEGAAPRGSLAAVALFFLRLGLTAFGGPAAHIAIMEDELVRRRGWFTREEFLDMLGAANLIPGPSSTEMAILIGQRRAGWRGLVLGGVCFILPASLITLALAIAYVRLGALPEAGAVLYGVKPVIIAVVVQALWGLGRTAIKSRLLAAVAVAAAAASLLGVGPLAVLVASGALAAGPALLAARGGPGRAALLLAPAGPLAAQGAAAAAAASLSGIFLVFLKVGAVLYGSGYVLLAFLREDLVERLHWFTEAQLLDAVAVGQITPGPVFTTATFIGYVLHGGAGALAATAGIFLPSFALVAASGPLVRRLRGSPTAGRFLDGVNAASLALMAVVAWYLGRSALVDIPACALALAGAVLLIRFRLNSVWLILLGAAVGVVRARM